MLNMHISDWIIHILGKLMGILLSEEIERLGDEVPVAPCHYGDNGH